MMDNVTFERAIVETFAALIESRGLKHKPVAIEAWPYKKNAHRTWQAMRNGGDESQRMTIRDAYALASVLGVSMSSICGMVEGKVLEAALNQPRPSKAEKKDQCHDIVPTGLVEHGAANAD